MTLLKNSLTVGVFKQFVRCRSQRRSLGKPPGVARTLEQRLNELNYKDPNVHYKVDIGFARPVTKRKDVLQGRLELLKKNKAELEKAARSNKLLVPLDEVRKEWSGEHVATSATHYNIFQDLFGDAHFTPALNLDVTYPEGYSVYRGNYLTPNQVRSAPEVSFMSKPESYWTLALTTPDGHLSKENGEYLLWLVGNIKGSEVTKGEELAKYLQPFPLSGLGACRYVFILYKQEGRIDYSSLLRSKQCSDPEERDFCTYEFYKERQGVLTPAGLAFFQAEWDESVRHMFHQVFSRGEPICNYDFPPHYYTKQTWFPLKQAFNLYLDRYRDEKQIAKEYFLRKMKHYDPWTGFRPQFPFPSAQHFKPNTPSWLKNEIKKHRLGRARTSDY